MSSTADGRRASAKLERLVLEWKARDEFETTEGFVANAVRYFSSRWATCLRDGSLKKSAAAQNEDRSKVLLSEASVSETRKNMEEFCEILSSKPVGADFAKKLEDFCVYIGQHEYVLANKVYLDIVMGSRKWQGDVPYLVEGNRNGPAVVQSVAEQINKKNSHHLDSAGVRDHTVMLRRLMTVMEAIHPNEDPSKNCL
eukprot:gnl/TRDRNA2_/TRDRNA2_193529_c0_seq1.p1 gnl/TRDRNA2_/TRDRNA2_193529_c0~~gnl/TRDRNA2_/TRDRNA2_193529_c0_seq1.p1  ORF type:complete len:198 (+),score=48.80 gnl/TRDRNA2_/TRDRNA2_193529_c0_seq1:290-883(+)